MKKIFVLLVAVLLLGAGCDNASQVDQQTSQTQELPVQTVVQPKEQIKEPVSAKVQTNILDMQTKCSDIALKYFNSKGYKTSEGNTYQNHFNSKLNKCFILISSYDLSSSGLFIDLFDTIEGKHYASFVGFSICDTAPGATDGKNNCQLNSGNIWYDGNDTKNPSDYQVGFGGLKYGGVGDENTQKQFMEHIQSFMND